jgi:Putative restriction endonuclease
MDIPRLMDRDELLAAWERLFATTEYVVRERYELNESGKAVVNGCPSAIRQLAFTDIYCQLTEQMGHLAGMSVPVLTPSFGIRVADVVWMPPEKWEGFDREAPVPFVPDLCVEVLLDREAPRDMGRRVISYLEGGAKEVIVVKQDGAFEFWGAEGQRLTSTFPTSLSLEPTYCQGGASARTVGSQVRDSSRGSRPEHRWAQ